MMNEFILKFPSANPEYFIETSVYREEISLSVEIERKGLFLLNMQTIARIETNIKARTGRIENYLGIEFEPGLIVVEDLTKDNLKNIIRTAIESKFFEGQATVDNCLPISEETPPVDIKIVNQRSPKSKDSIEILHTIHQEVYQEYTIKHISVLVKMDNLKYILRIVTTDDLKKYLKHMSLSNSLSIHCVAIPGIVVAKEVNDRSIDNIVAWCHKHSYFASLAPLLPEPLG